MWNFNKGTNLLGSKSIFSIIIFILNNDITNVYICYIISYNRNTHTQTHTYIQMKSKIKDKGKAQYLRAHVVFSEDTCSNSHTNMVPHKHEKL